MPTTNILRVLLHDMPVGTLSLNRNDGGEFRLLESYKKAYPRPVLGQVFLDDLDKVHSSRARVPPWFSNSSSTTPKFPTTNCCRTSNPW